MAADAELMDLLRRIEANQLKALDAQQETMALARAQAERADQAVKDARAMQAAALDRGRKLVRMVFPVILLLIALVLWIAFRWHLL